MNEKHFNGSLSGGNNQRENPYRSSGAGRLKNVEVLTHDDTDGDLIIGDDDDSRVIYTQRDEQPTDRGHTATTASNEN